MKQNRNNFLPQDDTEEDWKLIEDFPNYYISSYGRVYSLKSNKILAKRYSAKKYLQVSLYKSGVPFGKSFRVHRLVATHFIDNLYFKEQVNHKDGNKDNNKVSNLEWTTSSENMKHASDTGLLVYKRQVGQFNLNGGLIAKFKSLVDAQDSTGIKSSSIGSACKDFKKTSGGFRWKYLEPKYKKALCKPKINKARKVEQYNLDNELIKTFESANDASNKLNIPYSTVRGYCNSGKESSEGYKLKYKEGE